MKKIATIHQSVTMGQLNDICRGLGCFARYIDGRVWLCR